MNIVFTVLIFSLFITVILTLMGFWDWLGNRISMVKARHGIKRDQEQIKARAEHIRSTTKCYPWACVSINDWDLLVANPIGSNTVNFQRANMPQDIPINVISVDALDDYALTGCGGPYAQRILACFETKQEAEKHKEIIRNHPCSGCNGRGGKIEYDGFWARWGKCGLCNGLGTLKIEVLQSMAIK